MGSVSFLGTIDSSVLETVYNRHVLVQCGRYEFSCDGGCKSGVTICDGVADCIDNSDETNCPSSKFLTRKLSFFIGTEY